MSATRRARMPVSSSGVLSRNGLRPCGAELRRGGGAAGLAGVGDLRSVTATNIPAGPKDPLLFRVEQVFQLAHELADVAEVTIHGSKTHVSDLVETLELVHHQLADFVRPHLFLGTFLQRRFDLVGHALDGGNADGPLLTRLQQAGDQLLSLESLAGTVLLDHHVRDLVDPLVAGESSSAAETLAPSTDDLAFLALARVDNLVAEMCAERALHWRCDVSDARGSGGSFTSYDPSGVCSSRAAPARFFSRATLRPSCTMTSSPSATIGTNEIA